MKIFAPVTWYKSTPEQLQSHTVAELKLLTSKEFMNIKPVKENNPDYKPLSKMKKADLVGFIMIQVEHLLELKKLEIINYVSEEESLAIRQQRRAEAIKNGTYEGVMTYTNIKNLAASRNEHNTEFIRTPDNVVSILMTQCSRNGYAPEYICGECSTNLKKQLQVLVTEGLILDERCEAIHAAYKKACRDAGMYDRKAAKAKAVEVSNYRNIKEKITIDTQKLIDYAMALIDTGVRYKVHIGLSILGGRRLTELMLQDALFEPFEDFGIYAKGLLKDNPDDLTEVIFPVLCDRGHAEIRVN